MPLKCHQTCKIFFSAKMKMFMLRYG